tara:strand:+ start:1400 stop:2107 length:708 start_codon:yes stop_codon:yes gene_type:complete
MNINIDSRESKLKLLVEKNTDSNLNILFRNLYVGDIQIVKQDTSEKVLILERKSIDDLRNSLRDGRFSEQKKRLSSSDFIHKGYIFEGDPKTTHPEFLKMFRQIVLRIQLKDRMCVFFTENVSDTYTLIVEINRKLLKDTKLYSQEIDNSYIEKLKVSKKENLTPDRCFVLQMSQIPGISKKISINIASKYPNWTSLINGLKDKKSFMDNTQNMNIGIKKFENLTKYVLELNYNS